MVENTEAQQAKQQQRKLLAALKQSPRAVMMTDIHGAIEYVSPNFTDLTGYALEEVRGMNPRILKSGQTSAEEYAKLWATITSGGIWRGIFQNRKKNGEPHWQAATISAVRDADGEITHFLAVMEDVAERGRLPEQFQHYIESAPIAMVLTGRDGKIVLVNREAEKMFAFQRKELLGQPIELLVPEGSRAAHAGYRKEFHRASRSRMMGVGRELFGQRKDGSVFPLEVGLNLVHTDEAPMVLSAIVDVTERKRLEKELNEKTQEITKIQALVAVGRMANMIVHDICNPLSAVKMALQVIGERSAGQSNEEGLEVKTALQQVHYMEQVLDDLLSFSCEDSLAAEWLHVDKLLDDAIVLIRRHIKEHKVKVTARYETGLPTVHGDASKLRRAFCNLILNAVQATEGIEGREPEITIATHIEPGADGPKIRVSIGDNGRGLEPGQADKVFEPFFTTRAMGTGLGLAIVKRMVEQHHGSVELRARGSCGACASVILGIGPIKSNQLQQALKTCNNVGQHTAKGPAADIHKLDRA